MKAPSNKENANDTKLVPINTLKEPAEKAYAKANWR